MHLKKLLSAERAGNILLIALSLLALFHVLVLMRWVPSGIVWGGQVGDSDSNLILMETISLLATLFFILVIAARLRYFLRNRMRSVTRIGLWVMFAFFVLNTVGNLASDVAAENMIFAPLSVILAILALRVTIEKQAIIEWGEITEILKLYCTHLQGGYFEAILDHRADSSDPRHLCVGVV